MDSKQPHEFKTFMEATTFMLETELSDPELQVGVFPYFGSWYIFEVTTGNLVFCQDGYFRRVKLTTEA